MHTTKFTIEDYLAEFLRGKWGVKDENGNPTSIVAIPRDVYLYNTLHSLTIKTPRNAQFLIVGNVEIVIPHRKESNKKPERYNYISERGAEIFNKEVKLFFRAELHKYIDEKKHDEHYTYKDACFMFSSEYQIESFDPESMAKNYTRWKKQIREMKTERKKAYVSR